MATIINGDKIIELDGILSFTDGEWTLNGKPIDINKVGRVEENAKEINIYIQGKVNNLEVMHCTSINVRGDVGNIETKCGDIKVTGKVSGNVHTNCGTINCGDNAGNAKVNMGNINRK